MSRYPCKDCKDRHYACWGTCEKYLAVKNKKKVVDEMDDYIKSKGSYYQTRDGYWRR